MRRVVLILLAAVLSGIAFAAPAHAADYFRLDGDWGTQPAPSKRSRGAVMGPYATCAYNEGDEPDSYQLVVTQGSRRVASAADGVALVKPGTYTVTVTATCWGETKSVRRTLRVTAYTDAQTVSRAEYRRIHKGQSMKKVRRIVGGKLGYITTFKGRKYYTKPNSVIFGDVQFTFRKGKLTEKSWYDGGHD